MKHTTQIITLSMVLICRRFTCDMAARTTWDTVVIGEQKRPTTFLLPVSTVGMPAKLTRVQLRKHAGKTGKIGILSAAISTQMPNYKTSKKTAYAKTQTIDSGP